MSATAVRQISAIHTMLAAGHRNLRVERHTLILIGGVAAALLLASPHILTDRQIPDASARAVAWLALLTAVLGGACVADWFLTRAAKRTRDEAWSFIHRQVLKVFWLLLAIGTLLTFATFFFGGGLMIYAAWTILLGLGLYVHGLFSEELLEWVGIVTIAIGIGGLAAGLDHQHSRWIATSVCGLGLPLLAFLLDHGRSRPFAYRLAETAAWATLVLGAPLAVQLASAATAALDPPTLPLARFQQGAGAVGTWAVVLPAGTPVPVHLALDGDLFQGGGEALAPPLTLAQPLQVVTRDGQPTGALRLGDGSWFQGMGSLSIRISGLSATLTADGGPAIDAQMNIASHPTRGR